MTIWNDVGRRDENLKLPQPEMPQRHKLPKRFECRRWPGTSVHRRNVIPQSCAFLDIIIRHFEERLATKFLTELQHRRFTHPCDSAATWKGHTNELRQFLNFHDGFNRLSLEAQRCHQPTSEWIWCRAGHLSVGLPFSKILGIADVAKNAAGLLQLIMIKSGN